MTGERSPRSCALAFAVAYRMLGSVAEAEDVDAGGAAAPAQRAGRREPRGVPHHRDDPAGDRRPALRPRAPRGLHRLVAARAAGRGRRRAAASRTRRRSRSPSSSCSSGSTPTSAPCSCCASRSTTRSPTSPRSSTRPRPTRARSSAAPAAASPTSARASTPTRASAGRLVARFLDAAREGDMDGLVALLAPDAVMIGDGGGKARAIAAPMHGAARIARALLAFYGISRGVGRQLRARDRQRPARLPHRRARRPARQRHVARRRGRRDHPPALDRQPRQAGPPRADVRRRAAPGADNPTGMTPATPRAGRLRNRRYCSHAQHALHQLPPRDGSLPAASPLSARPPAPQPTWRGELTLLHRAVPPSSDRRPPRFPPKRGGRRRLKSRWWGCPHPQTPGSPRSGAPPERETSEHDDDAFLPQPLPPSRLPRPGAPRTAARRRELAHLSPFAVARLATPSPARRAPVCLTVG